MLTEAGTNQTVHVLANYRDFDGEGGSPPTIDTLRLRSHNTYVGVIEIFNERLDAGQEGYDLREKIMEEAETHRMVYSYSAVTGHLDRILVGTNDLDSNGFPLGLEYTVIVTTGPEA
ncbi:MAG: hypothetical protein GWN16_03705, partial [Calditrichae bacterium]|nr:hypothetical protein [Calditrichia bacterium]